MTNRLQNALGTRFRRIITSDPTGVPPWLGQISAGDDAGLFQPADAPWVVHGDLSTLIGGIRALLIQALHPGSMAGVAQHSRYETDPLGRLAGTTKWLTILTFGGMHAIEVESSRVNEMHKRVAGSFTASDGSQTQYRATDPKLLQWVHVAFTDSFLRTFQMYSPERQLDIADEYVEKWAQAVTYLGLPSGPKSEKQLQDVMHGYFESGELQVTEQTKRVIAFIKRPPLSRTALLVYGFLFQAALVSIPSPYQEMLALKARPKWLVVPVARVLMKLMQLAIGSHSPLEEAAIDRLTRIGAISSN
ncbi:MAG: oxygenase MpaB family protein [Actinomycetes bacterium]